jgi:hypothetical protein
MRRRMTVLWLIPIGLLGLAVGMGLEIRSRRVHAPSAEADRDCVQVASEFTAYPLAFLGPEFQGLPLTGCQRAVTPEKYNLDGTVREPAMDFFVFAYGSCVPAGDEGRCSPPVSVLVDPPCGPTLGEQAVKEKVRIRGEDVLVKSDGSLRIEGRNFKATIYGLAGDYQASKQKAVEVVQALHGANALAAGLKPDSNLDVGLGGNTVCR